MAKKKRTLLDARLEELEREFSRVQGDIQSLSKAVKTPETLRRPLPDSSRESPDPVPPRRTLASKPAASAEPASSRPVSAMPGAEPPRAKKAGVPPPPVEEEYFPELARDRLRSARSGDNRLGHYLSAMDFAGGTRPRQDRKVIRNKAIFMLVLTLIVAYVVVKLLVSP